MLACLFVWLPACVAPSARACRLHASRLCLLVSAVCGVCAVLCVLLLLAASFPSSLSPAPHEQLPLVGRARGSSKYAVAVEAAAPHTALIADALAAPLAPARYQLCIVGNSEDVASAAAMSLRYFPTTPAVWSVCGVLIRTRL